MTEKFAFSDQSRAVNEATKQNLPVQLIQQRTWRGLVRERKINNWKAQLSLK